MPVPDNAARDQQIVRLWEQGWSIGDIVHRFGRSRKRIRQIVGGDQEKVRRNRRAVCLEAMARLQNDLDMWWPCEIIVPMLGLRGWPKKLMGDYFLHRRRKTISLRQLMDLVLPHGFKEWPDDIPLLRCAGIGDSTHQAMVDALSACNLGPSFQADWRQRMDCYRRYWERGVAGA